MGIYIDFGCIFDGYKFNTLEVLNFDHLILRFVSELDLIQ